MDLDELKTTWQALDRRIEERRDLNLATLRELKLHQVRSALRRHVPFPLIDLVSGIAVAGVLGAFLAVHIREARFAIPALTLQGVAIATIVVTARQLAMIGRLDYSAPVVAIQRAIGEVKSSRVRTTRWLLLIAPLLWPPMAVVGAKGLLGVDLYQGFGAMWLAANVVFGAVFLAVALWIAHRWADSFRDATWVKGLADSLAGRSLARATGYLDELERFEKQ
jgi:serine/threonine-protein kinase